MQQYKQQNMQSLKKLASNTQKNRHDCSCDTIKLNAAFCCTTVRDEDVLNNLRQIV